MLASGPQLSLVTRALSLARAKPPRRLALAPQSHEQASTSHEHPFCLSLSLLTIPRPCFLRPPRATFSPRPLCHADLCRKIEAHSHSPGALHQRHHHTTPPVQQQEDRTKASGDKATKDAAAAVLPPCLQPASHRPSARIVREPRLFPPSCRPSRFLSARPPAPGPSKHAVALQQRSRGGARDAVT
jgi:hypothetical protein